MEPPAMTPQELRARLADLAVRVATMTRPLVTDAGARYGATQLARAASSAAANYRAATVARSHAEFTSKIGTALEEADETVYWLEYLSRVGWLKEDATFAEVLQESLEMAAILGASKRTSTRNAHLRRTRLRRSGQDEPHHQAGNARRNKNASNGQEDGPGQELETERQKDADRDANYR
jgi:four helix bundle protein